MVLSSPFTYAVNPDDEDEKPDAPLSLRGEGKKASSGGGGEKAVRRDNTFPQFNKLEAALRGEIAGFLTPRQRAHLAGMSRGDRDAMHLTEKEYLSAYLKRGESPGEAIASPMSFLTDIMGMREQTVVFGPCSDYLYHTVFLARTLVMEIALATILTGKITVASIKGDLYKTLVDVARARPGLVQRSFIEFLPTEFEGGNAAFLPGLNHKYASYCIFGTEEQIAAFQTHMNGQLAVLQEMISLEYTSLEEAHINTKATYIVIREGRLAEKKAALDAYFAANREKTLLIDSLRETLNIESYELPKNVSHLVFSNTRHNLTTVGDYFLSRCKYLTTVDLTSLARVTNIGNYFLSCCKALTTVDLSPLARVTTVGNFFLFHCSGLIAVDLSDLTSITNIDNYFLDGCIHLMTLDLTPLANVTTVGAGFLDGYRGVTPIDPQGLMGHL